MNSSFKLIRGEDFSLLVTLKKNGSDESLDNWTYSTRGSLSDKIAITVNSNNVTLHIDGADSATFPIGVHEFFMSFSSSVAKINSKINFEVVDNG